MDVREATVVILQTEEMYDMVNIYRPKKRREGVLRRWG